MAIYDTIKAQEANFPLPTPSATVTVGSFNAGTGDFHYAVPVYQETVATHPGPEVGNGHPEREQFSGAEVGALNVFSVQSRFPVTGRQGPLVVSVPGHGPVNVSANSVDIDVGTASSVTFSLSCNGQEFYPELPLRITRPMVGA